MALELRYLQNQRELIYYENAEQEQELPETNLESSSSSAMNDANHVRMSHKTNSAPLESISSIVSILNERKESIMGFSTNE